MREVCIRKYHHYGIPTKAVTPEMTFVETHGFRFYSTPFDANELHIQWHYFPENHGLPELVTKVPHIAFEVDDFEAEIQNKKVLLEPYSPLEGFKVAFIEEEGVPIELIETELTDEELSKLEQEKFNK